MRSRTVSTGLPQCMSRSHFRNRSTDIDDRRPVRYRIRTANGAGRRGTEGAAMVALAG